VDKGEFSGQDRDAGKVKAELGQLLVRTQMKRSDWLFIIAIILIVVGAVALLADKLTYEQFYALIGIAIALIGGGAYVRKKEA